MQPFHDADTDTQPHAIWYTHWKRDSKSNVLYLADTISDTLSNADSNVHPKPITKSDAERGWYAHRQ